MLDEVVTKSRDRRAALKLLRKRLKRRGRPAAIVTDKLKSYGAALRELSIDASRHQTSGLWINNRAENGHLPLRRRERAMLRFRQMRSLHKFAAVHGSVENHPRGQA
ncbi:DDE-type integrase/transposase/recombinase [Roseitalea porphyridii]|uniref:DDE-type integrase/transposase/recombinase n=1 Tax=Roseitalea porphyridii TaxID=1852022 RepID=UPI001AECA203|nr:DDE-type integrase/transposase/recombinase [Roseitalea porphyridii]